MRFYPFLPAFVFLAACGASQKTAQKAVVVDMEDIDVKAKPKSAEVYQPVPERVWDILHTDLKLRFRIPQREVMGQAQIRLKPYAYPQDSIILDAKIMDIQEVQISGKDGSYTPAFRSDSARLYIALRRTQNPTDTALLTIDYIGKPYAKNAGGFAAIRDDRGLYFVNAEGKISGKPLQIWTQGETESNSHWFPTTDKPNERSTFRFEITVPDSLTVLSNGENTLEALNGTAREKTAVWEMKQPMPPYLAMMAIGKFVRVKDSSVNGVPVDYYVEPQYAPYAKDIFSNTPEMIRFFNQETGVLYPWNKYSQVAVRDYVSGAMENTTASLFGEFVNGNARERKDRSVEGVVAHELFHQWFGDYVTAKSWSNLTVNESFATLGEFLWEEYKYGADAAAVLRQNYLERYLGRAQTKDPALVRHYYASEGEMFDHVSYQKGGLILWAIRERVGREKFREAMKYYLEKNANSAADAQDWRKALEAVTGWDWNPYFNQWYNRGGHPVVQFSYKKDPGGRGTWLVANQSQPTPYKMDIEVAVMDESGALRRLPMTLKGEKDSLLITHAAGALPVIIPDAKHIIVGEVKEEKTEADWVRQYVLAEDYRSKAMAMESIPDATFTQPLYDAFLQTLKGSRNAVRTATLNDLYSRKGPWHTEEMKTLLRQISGNTAEPVAVRNVALQVYGQWDSGKSNLSFYRSMLGDSSYYISGNALRFLRRADSTEAVQAARSILDRNDARSLLLTTAAETVAQTGLPEDLARIRENAAGKWGGTRSPLIGAVVSYWIADKGNGADALELLRLWYSEEEASFVRSGHLSAWDALAVQAQKQAGNKAWDAKKETLIQFLGRMQQEETDPELKSRMEKMVKRVRGEKAEK